MTISIGIDYIPGQWRVCSVEPDRQAEFQVCATAGEMQALTSQICTLYPEPTIVVSLHVATPFGALATLTDQQLEHLAQQAHPAPACTDVTETLLVVRSLSLRSYCAPSVEYLPTLPAYRRLLRPALGSASEVCAIVALLHHMRKQDASWPEMNFLSLRADERSAGVIVVKDGQIVNGIGLLQGSTSPATRASLQEQEQAYREGLRQDLAGLLAIHQVEDVVVRGRGGPALLEQLADCYQLYLFPPMGPDDTDYEAALGAALLAEGLEREGSAAEVITHLHIPQAGPQAVFLPHINVS